MTYPKLTLYRARGSCAEIPYNLLRYLSIPSSSVMMDFSPDKYAAADGSFTNAQYRAVHPSGYVPALRIQGEGFDDVLTENPAVVAFIVNLTSEQHLLGDTAMEKARVMEWTNWLSGTLHAVAFASILRPARFADPSVLGATEEVLAVIRANGFRKLRECFERIDASVGEDGYAVGGKLTVVDFYLLWFWMQGMKHASWEMAKYTKYQKVVARMLEIPAVKEVIMEEGREEFARLSAPVNG